MAPHLEVWRADGVALVPLDGGRVAVGRAGDNDIVIDDPMVSRHHLVLDRLAAGWSVSDLGSTNGTFVNGQRLAQSRPLYPDDQIMAGETKLVYRDD